MDLNGKGVGDPGEQKIFCGEGIDGRHLGGTCEIRIRARSQETGETLQAARHELKETVMKGGGAEERVCVCERERERDKVCV